jgi:hypothetical protein
MSSQTPAQKRALDAVWRAHPQVIALEAAVAAHVATITATGAEAMTQAITFAGAWVKANGPLPDSGILCD